MRHIDTIVVALRPFKTRKKNGPNNNNKAVFRPCEHCVYASEKYYAIKIAFLSVTFQSF